MLAPDDDVHVARITCRIVNALVQYFNQARLLFKRPEQLAHPLEIDKFRLRKYMRSAVDIDVAARFLTFETALAQQNRVLQHAIVKRLLFFHQLDDLRADREQALAAELYI